MVRGACLDLICHKSSDGENDLIVQGQRVLEFLSENLIFSTAGAASSLIHRLFIFL